MLKIWKDWQRRQRRNKNRKIALDEASVLFISPAKSGRTWIRVMLSHAYHLTYGTPVDAVIARDNFHRVDARIPNFFFTHITKEPANVRKLITPVAQAGKAVIGIVRDPRDVAVSLFHHLSHRSQGDRRSEPGASASARGELFPFLVSNRQGLPFVIERMNEVKRFVDQHENATLFRYEDFKRDAPGELRRMLRALGNEVPMTSIEAAVEFARFENLQKREAEGFFATRILQPGDPEEPNSFKVRRGKVGGYLDDLLPEQIAEVDHIVDKTLIKGLGYRSEERDRGSQVPTTAATLAG